MIYYTGSGNIKKLYYIIAKFKSSVNGLTEDSGNFYTAFNKKRRTVVLYQRCFCCLAVCICRAWHTRSGTKFFPDVVRCLTRLDLQNMGEFFIQ